MILETKIWPLNILTATGVLWLLVLFSNVMYVVWECNSGLLLSMCETLGSKKEGKEKMERHKNKEKNRKQERQKEKERRKKKRKVDKNRKNSVY